jgi:hypothetical protein
MPNLRQQVRDNDRLASASHTGPIRLIRRWRIRFIILIDALRLKKIGRASDHITTGRFSSSIEVKKLRAFRVYRFAEECRYRSTAGGIAGARNPRPVSRTGFSSGLVWLALL